MNITLKFLMVGDTGVGKTALIERLVDDTFSNSLRADIKFDYKERTVFIDNSIIKLQVWDYLSTNCQRQQYPLRNIPQNPASRGAHGFVVVFDLTEQLSYNNAKLWLNEIERYGGPLFHRTILVGNKTDRYAHRMIDMDVAQKFAQSLGISYIETSCKTGDNVINAFTMLAVEIYENSMKPKPVEKEIVTHTSYFQKILRKFY